MLTETTTDILDNPLAQIDIPADATTLKRMRAVLYLRLGQLRRRLASCAAKAGCDLNAHLEKNGQKIVASLFRRRRS